MFVDKCLQRINFLEVLDGVLQNTVYNLHLKTRSYQVPMFDPGNLWIGVSFRPSFLIFYVLAVRKNTNSPNC